MSKSDMNVSKAVPVEVVGSYVVQDAPAYFNQNGTLASPVKYHYEPVKPSSSPQMITILTEKRNSLTTPGFNRPGRARLRPLSFYYYKHQLLQSMSQTSTRRPGNSTTAPIDSYYVSMPTTRIDTGGYAATAANIDSLTRRAIIDLRNKIKDQSINAAQAVAERKNTARTVTDAATSIYQSIRAVRRGDLAGAAKALGVKKPRGRKQGAVSDAADIASKHWLALQYGWKPLLNDVYGAVEQMAKVNNNVQFRSVRVSKTGVFENKWTRKNSLNSGYRGHWTNRFKVTESVTVKYGVTFSQSSSAPTTLKQLGITNPALVAWELVPFSFVADWFLPIGNYLSSLDATVGCQFESGYCTIFRKATGEAAEDMNQTNGSTTEMVFALNSWDRVEVTRTPLSGFPSSPLPPFKNPVSVSHATSAVALLYQLFKR